MESSVSWAPPPGEIGAGEEQVPGDPIESEGKPLQLFEFVRPEDPDADTEIKLNDATINKIVEECGDRPLCVVAIVGPSNGGKSLVLNFMIRCLAGLEKGETDWIGWNNKTKPLEGFSFKTALEPQTRGILIWSRPFFLKNADGKEVAILLVDTQGTNDEYTTLKDMSSIVGLSLLSSSITIFNNMNNLQEDVLQALNMFTEFGLLVKEKEQETGHPFQSLCFLIRDWNNPDDFPYGGKGGKQFLERKLELKPNQSKEAKAVRKALTKCFDEVNCFLMPSIGEDALSKTFSGKLEEVSTLFAKKLEEFVNSLFKGEDLVTKKILGKEITALELKSFLEMYVQVFNSDTVPSAKIMMEGVFKVYKDIAIRNFINKSVKQFTEALEKKFTLNEFPLFYEEEEVRSGAQKVEDKILREFDELFGDKEATEYYNSKSSIILALQKPLETHLSKNKDREKAANISIADLVEYLLEEYELKVEEFFKKIKLEDDIRVDNFLDEMKKSILRSFRKKGMYGNKMFRDKKAEELMQRFENVLSERRRNWKVASCIRAYGQTHCFSREDHEQLLAILPASAENFNVAERECIKLYVKKMGELKNKKQAYMQEEWLLEVQEEFKKAEPFKEEFGELGHTSRSNVSEKKKARDDKERFERETKARLGPEIEDTFAVALGVMKAWQHRAKQFTEVGVKTYIDEYLKSMNNYILFCWSEDKFLEKVDITKRTVMEKLETDCPIKNKEFISEYISALNDSIEEWNKRLKESFEPKMKREAENEGLPKLRWRRTIPTAPAYYITRRIIRRSKLNNGFLSEEVDDIFLFSGVNQENLSNLLPGKTIFAKSFSQTKQVTSRFILLDVNDHFHRIASLTPKNVHWVKEEGKAFHWVRSKGDVQLMQKHISRDQDIVSEDELVKKLVSADDTTPFCVAGTSGTGKTMFFSNLASRIQSACPSKLVFYFHLSEIIPILKKEAKEDYLISLLLTCVDIKTEEERKYLKSKLAKEIETYEVALFLDGYGEVLDDDEREIANAFIATNTGNENVRIGLATRPCGINCAETILKSPAYQLAPLQPKEVERLLTKRWIDYHGATNRVQLHAYAQECLQSISFNPDIIGVELLGSMLADIFADEVVQGHDILRYSFCSTFDVFHKFFTNKFSSLEKVFSNVDKNQLKFIEDHHVKLAFLQWRSLQTPEMDVTEVTLARNLKESMFSFIDLLQTGSRYDGPQFHHRAFAEYLVAKHVVELLSSNHSRGTALLQNIFSKLENKTYHVKSHWQLPSVPVEGLEFEPLYGTIHYFINGHLEGKVDQLLLPNDTILQELSLPDLLVPCAVKNLMNSFKLMLKISSSSSSSSSSLPSEDEKWELCFLTAAYCHNTETMKKVVEFTGSKSTLGVVEIEGVNITPLQAAVASGSFAVTKYLLELNSDSIKSRLIDCSDLIKCCIANSCSDKEALLNEKKKIIDMILLIDKNSLDKTLKWLNESVHQEFFHYLQQLQNISCEAEIGAGETSYVFSGKFGHNIAIKKLKEQNLSKAEAEKELWRNLTNNNIVRLQYFSCDAGCHPLFVMELAKYDLCKKMSSPVVHLEERSKLVKILKDTAKGLEYLHLNGIIHGDIKPQNILIFYDTVSGNEVAKIGDFGNSRRLPQAQLSVRIELGAKVTEEEKKWMSPEELLGLDQGFLDTTKAVDIFRLAVVIFFTLSVGKVSEARLLEVPEMREPHAKMLLEANHLIRLMLRKAPEARPNIGQVLCHPLFWPASGSKDLDFLKNVAINLQEVNDSVKQGIDDEFSGFHKTTFPKEQEKFNFTKNMEQKTFELLTQMLKVNKERKGKKGRRLDYDTGTITKVVKFIRDKLMHSNEISPDLDLFDTIDNEKSFSTTKFIKLILGVAPDITVFFFEKVCSSKVEFKEVRRNEKYHLYKFENFQFK